MKSFEDLGLSPQMLKVIQQKGFESPTPIQEKTIPAILQGSKDIVAQAQTGTGKTAAFGLPLIERLERRPHVTQALILTPTRELAIQVSEEIHSLKGDKPLSIVPIYGGQSIGLQLQRLKKAADVVVGTPGRMLDHLRRRTLKLDQIEYLILDEADEMLNMGFLEDVVEIMKSLPAKRRTFLFSATMPEEIQEIAENYMGEHEVIKVSKGQLTVSQIDQIYFEVSNANKFEALCRIIDVEEPFYGIVFCKTKVDTDQVAGHLLERGYDAAALHGDISQGSREKILNQFKKGSLNILVATDVAARGIDVQNLTHVINYALPYDSEAYVHRIGRTGRAGKEGIAITFITPAESRRLQFIQRKIKTDIRKAQLPTVKDLVRTKRERFRARLEDLAQETPEETYRKLAQDLLENHEPEDILASVLQFATQGELIEKKYTEIENVAVDTQGKTRLYVRQGKKDGWTRDKLIQWITKQCGIAGGKIREVEVLDKFSFVTLPFREAEKVLTHFKDKKSGAPLVTKANKDRPRR